MALRPPPPLKVNGRYVSHASLRVSPTAEGLLSQLPPLSQHVREISWQETIGLVLPRGVHPIPLPRGDGGDYTASGTIGLTVEAWVEWLSRFPNADTAGITDFDFSVVLEYKPPGTQAIVKVEWEEASIVGVSGGSSQGGTDGPIVQLTWHIRRVLTNGRCLAAADQDR